MTFNSWFKQARLGLTTKELIQAKFFLNEAYTVGKKGKQTFGAFIQTNDAIAKLNASALATMLDPLERAFNVGRASK